VAESENSQAYCTIEAMLDHSIGEVLADVLHQEPPDNLVALAVELQLQLEKFQTRAKVDELVSAQILTRSASEDPDNSDS
jgi:hypothetical protein